MNLSTISREGSSWCRFRDPEPVNMQWMKKWGVLTSKWCIYISSPAHKGQEHCGREDRDIVRAREGVVCSDTVLIGYNSEVAHMKSKWLGLHVPTLDKIKLLKLSVWMGRGSGSPISLWEAISSWWLLGKSRSFESGMWALRGYPSSHIIVFRGRKNGLSLYLKEKNKAIHEGDRKR